MLRSSVAAVVVLGMAATGVAGQDKPALTLTEAVERAQRAQPQVVQAENAVRSADARLRAARGAYLPNLTLTSSAGQFYTEGQRIDPSTGQLTPSNSTNISLNGNVQSNIELFDGFRRGAESRSARASREAASENLENARFSQELITTNQFFDVLAALQLVRVREASVRRADEQLKVSIARLRAGAAIRSDSLRSLVNLGTAQIQLLTAQSQLASGEANLGRLVGNEGPVSAVDDSAFYVTHEALDTVALRTEALNRSPQVTAAEASYRAALATVDVARAGYWPTVNLGGSASLNGSQQNDYRFNQQRQATLSLNWQVFNRFTREQNIANQRAAADNAEATAAEARRLVLANLTARLAELEAARTRTTITGTSLAAATEDLRVQQERYRLGVATIVDVLTSQEALTQAEVDVVNARFDYLRARAQIQALIGRKL
ncbi:MAG: TolC family protein [Gemmatimonadales bacterium]|nr:TolC family protein [Gemmatimonadales bacterium]